ncbi:hypothetical protein L3Q82_020379 [Scortum barcoo]|uniref:Uncharacterized protein n=1 Tax=Scortum barcoo TaxID=214431 RepID=A0ACB8V757_9TELE|nr:hypothetical protein L3Q82_020379 [Scortum barcoo]
MLGLTTVLWPHVGRYYLGNGTKVDIEEPTNLEFIALVISLICLIISVTGNIVFICYRAQRPVCEQSGRNIETASPQAGHDNFSRRPVRHTTEGGNDLNYAALHFPSRGTRGRKKRELKTEERNTQRTLNYTVVQWPTVSDSVRPGDLMTLQCSVLSDSENKTCPGDHNMYWFKTGSDKSHPNIIYTDGNTHDECDKRSDTQKSCIYRFSKNFSSSDAGTYYCAVATCGEILFGDGTKVEIEQTASYEFVALVVSLVCLFISVTGNIVFICYRAPRPICEQFKDMESASSQPRHDNLSQPVHESTSSNISPTRTVTSPGLALPGPHPGARPGAGALQASKRLVAGSLPTVPGQAQPEMADVGPPSSRLTTTAGRSMRGRCNVVWVAAVMAWGPRRPNPWTKTLAIGRWNVTSLGGKGA